MGQSEKDHKLACTLITGCMHMLIVYCSVPASSVYILALRLRISRNATCTLTIGCIHGVPV